MEKKLSIVERALLSLEKAGNKLPDPVTLFVVIILIMIGASYVLATLGVEVVNPATHETVKAVSLLSEEGLRKMFTNVVKNFQGFPPLGLVLVTMLGVGVAERSGLMEAAMKHSVSRIAPAYVTLLIIFVGLMSNAAGDAGLIVLPPLAASIYYALGRNPLAGLFTAYFAAAGGFHANLLVNMTDVLETSFTIPAAQLVAPNYDSSPAMNYYFIAASLVVLLGFIYYISVRVIEPRLGTYVPHEGLQVEKFGDDNADLELKGIKWAGICAGIFAIIVVLLCLGDHPFMGDDKTGSLLSTKAPLMAGIVPLVMLFFLVPGIVYGWVTGSIKNDKDVVTMMNQTMGGMGGYIVLAFIASQFLAYFKWSNMGLIIAIQGAKALQDAGFVGIALIVCFIFLSSFINLFIGSASAKWAIMAPVFVPMFYLVGYDPALTQMAYRIGDSITNPISPLFPYFPIVIAFAAKYVPKIGMGTLISNMLPFSVVVGIVWVLLLVVFILLGIPMGPDGGIYV